MRNAVILQGWRHLRIHSSMYSEDHIEEKEKENEETYSFRTVSILSLVWPKRERLSCTYKRFSARISEY
jgi:hypothetical protein